MAMKKLTEHLSKEEKDSISEIYNDKSKAWDERVKGIMLITQRSERVTRRWLVELGLKGNSLEDTEQFKKAKSRKLDKKKKYYIITWAQNGTPVHKQFLENIKAYAQFLDADIHIILGRYKNPTSVFTDKNFDNWADEVMPYADANRHDVHKYLSILSDVKIQPTQHNPLSGLEGMSGINSCIIGSPRLHMQTIPALEMYKPKVMWTTGACTIKNYTDSKNGKKGEFHHTIGFVIVEVSDKEKFFCRQVSANLNGDFCDLFFEVKGGVVGAVDSISACVLGDIHLGQEDRVVMNKTKELLDVLTPKYTVVHDIFDGDSVNHHEQRNFIKQYHKLVDGTNSLKKEVDYMLDWVAKMKKYNLVVVRSNHDEFLDRWINDIDWKKNLHNSVDYMEYAHALLTRKAQNGLIPYILNKHHKEVKTLNRNESFRVNGWELAAHGDKGSGGSRGSLEQFRRLNTKVVIGHYHSPARKDGALSVGTTTKLRIGYNVGPSSWLNASVIIHKNGKAQHVLFIDGEYSTLGAIHKKMKPKKEKEVISV